MSLPASSITKRKRGKGKTRREKEFYFKNIKKYIYDFFVQMKIKYNTFYKNFMFVRVFRCF